MFQFIDKYKGRTVPLCTGTALTEKLRPQKSDPCVFMQWGAGIDADADRNSLNVTAVILGWMGDGDGRGSFHDGQPRSFSKDLHDRQVVLCSADVHAAWLSYQ